jgi:hypothetical protein
MALNDVGKCLFCVLTNIELGYRATMVFWSGMLLLGMLAVGIAPTLCSRGPPEEVELLVEGRPSAIEKGARQRSQQRSPVEELARQQGSATACRDHPELPNSTTQANYCSKKGWGKKEQDQLRHDLAMDAAPRC